MSNDMPTDLPDERGDDERPERPELPDTSGWSDWQVDQIFARIAEEHRDLLDRLRRT